MDWKSGSLNRRTVLGAIAAVVGIAAAGCRRSATETTGQPDAPQPPPAAAPAKTAAAMTVYRDPSCGCCEAWAGLARNAGYQVQLIDHPDMPAIKRQYGVPGALQSCHTALVGDYAIEGHVPMADVQRLLARRPPGVKGLAVPGMPLGAPGMEVPDGTSQPFQVMAFDAAGKVSAFTA